jgi:hypothetical protein
MFVDVTRAVDNTIKYRQLRDEASGVCFFNWSRKTLNSLIAV